MMKRQGKPAYWLTLTALLVASLLGLLLTPATRRVRAFTGDPVTNTATSSTGGVRQDYATAAVQPAAAFAPMTIGELKTAITTANGNATDDVIDLGGQTFTLTVVDNSTNGDNGLPVIGSDNGHKLVIENGRVERSTAGGTAQFRLFYISPGANLTLNRVSVANGRAFSGGNGLIGGGLFNQGVLTLNSCTVAGNQASGSGGGIYNLADDAAPTATLTLNRCTVAGNSSTSAGGGIVNAGSGAGNTATLVINNSTISGNSASQQGGGIDSNSAGTMTINNSTIVGNSASSSGGGINAAGSVVSIGGCIIALNRAMGGPDVNASVTSQGYNLIGETSNSSGFNQTGDQTGTQAAPLDPGIELDAMNKPLLKDNGGPTQTIALLAGSPAFDKGKIFSATTDQRGVSRPMDNSALANATDGDGSDIGAFEAVTCGTGSTVVSNTDDSGAGSLRCALASAFTGSTITFNLPTPATINLTSAQLTVDKDVTIQGLGANLLTVQRSTAGGTPQFRIFDIKSGATVAISGLTITNGHAPNGDTQLPSGDGGSVRNAGKLTLTAVTVSGNQAGNGFGTNHGGSGGGIHNASGATLTVNNCTVSSNRAGAAGTAPGRFIGGSGGGIYNSDRATLTVSNSTISGNQTGNAPRSLIHGSGGGIYNTGTALLTLSNCTITGNSSDNGGGGLDAEGSTPPTVGSSIIAGNSAPTGADFQGSVTSQGYNLIGDASGSSGFTQMTDLTGTQATPLNPGLELDAMNKPLLKDNGGPTQTIALLCDSPAIDKGNNFTAATTDQRGVGFARTFDNSPTNASDGTDIGAFEQVCNQPPVAHCQNVTVSAGANCTASASIDNGSSDPNGDAITVTQSPAGPYAKGTTTVTLTVTDSHLASSSCTATVTVVDAAAPTILCNNVGAQSANTDGSCAATVPDVTSLVRAQSTDNCTPPASLNITQSPTANSTVSGTGSHPITVTVKDADNNSNSCVVSFTLNDTTPPAITCPANLIKSTDPNQCAAVVNFTPTATDNCSGVGTPVCTPPSGSSFPKGTTTVTCSVKDAANNQSAPCSFSVIVSDTQAPSIACPSSLTVPAATGQCAATVSYSAPAVGDNCPGVGAPLCTPLSGSAFAKGTTTVNCTVKDAANNQSACSFSVTVVDTQAPTIVCPVNIIANTVNAGDANVAVTFAAPTVADNCSGVTVACVPPSGSLFPRGTTTVTCTATDAATNRTSCSFTVRIFDYVILDSPTSQLLRFDSATGEYDFFDCRKNKSVSGRGVVTINSCKTELRDTKPDRTVTVLANPCTKVGNATVIYQGVTYTLSDTNLSGNPVKCP